jgi:hypothetical protein
MRHAILCLVFGISSLATAAEPPRCATADLSREQMSAFLSVTFGLVLYGL